MRTLWKWAIRGFFVILLLAVTIGVFGYAFLSRTIQPPAGDIAIAGLSAPVKIVRDREGIPHIEAKTRNDALAALGFAHAQDRLWQMEVLRMSGQGRLSEMFGKATKNTDVFLRTLGFFDQSKQSLAVLAPETIAGLEAYARGVNAFIHRKTRLLEAALPPEFLILGHQPEDWQPAHSVVTLKMMSLDLSKNMGNELTRLALAADGIGPKEMLDLFPTGPLDKPRPMPDLRQLYKLKKPVLTADANDNSAAMLDEFIPNTGIWASNNWVIAGSRTESGKPLLANDPHLAFASPSLWYLAHISWEEAGKMRNVIGASLPSTPLILLGRNDNVAWGFTNAGADVQDVFIEQLNEGDDTQYKTPFGWQNFTLKDETIHIKGGEDHTFTIRSTRHGPVLPGFYKKIAQLLPSTHVAALQWPGFSAKDTGMDAAFAVMGSDSLEGYVKGVSKLISPMQAMVIADTSGKIGLFAPARVPIRHADNAIEGRAPVPGWDEKYDWQGFIPVNELPLIVNPPSGAIGTANSRFVDKTYRHHITYDWEEIFRLQKIRKLVLKAEKKHSISSMKAAQGDIHSAALERLRDLLVANIGEIQFGSGEALQDLKKWDGMMDMNRAEPLIMNAWLRALVAAIYKDDLPTAFERYNHQRATALIRLFEQGGARDWCDDQTTARVEQCAEIIAKSLDSALAELRAKYGKDSKKWRWGEAHKMIGKHTPFSKIWPLDRFFTISIPSHGGRYTLSRGATSFKDKKAPYASVHGASYRAIYDFSDLDKSLFIHTTGQSGHFLSTLYDNMAERWAKVEYLPMSTKKDDYHNGALGTWNLEPKR
jgi:penicillin amidase